MNSFDNHLFRSSQKGAVVLLTVVLLLVIVTIVTLYTGRVQSLEHRIALNNQNHRLAAASAQNGLNQGMARLSVLKHWQGKTLEQTLADNSSFKLEGREQELISDKHKRLITLQSTGTSHDGLASVTVTEQALIYPLLANIPAAALILEGGFDTNGQFELGVDPETEGSYSIWSNDVVDMSSEHLSTCANEAVFAGECHIKPFSYLSERKDFVDGDENFPADLFGYLFNESLSKWQALRLQANGHLISCSELNKDSKGFIWIDGNCHLSAEQIVADESAPIILIIKEGDIQFAPHSRFHGLLVSFRSEDTLFDFEVNMANDSLIRGALVSNHSLGKSGGRVRVVHEPELLKHLRTQPALTRVARISGSWKDF